MLGMAIPNKGVRSSQIKSDFCILFFYKIARFYIS
jgi:hypothetical protein